MNETQRQILDLAADHHTAPKEPSRAIDAAVMKYVEERIGDDGVIVGYGDDRTIHGMNSVPEGWYAHVPPVEGTRYRVFFPKDEDGGGVIPNLVETVMAAIGATFVGVFDERPDLVGTYDRRGKLSAHYVLPDSAPFVLALGSRIESENRSGEGATP